MAYKKPIVVLLLFFNSFPSFSQAIVDEQVLIATKKKLKDNEDVGRLIGKPVNKSNFKFDSSGYKIFYVCEAYLTARKAEKPILLHYLIGKKNDSELLVTIDENFNNNFSDDSVRKINLSSYDNCDFKDLNDCVKLHKNNLGDNATEDLTLHIVAPQCFKNLVRHSSNRFLDTSNIAMESPFEHVFIAKLKKESFQISIRNIFPRIDFNDVENLRIYINRNNSGQSTATSFKLKDTLEINNGYFVASRLSKDADTLTIRKLRSNFIIGNKVGFYAFNVKGIDILNKNPVYLQNFKGKYVLLEFWGTWCEPCLSLHDELINLLKINKNLNYLGVAYDVDINKVINYISKDPFINRQIFIDMKKKDNIITEYNVENFPTFILIDKRGKIVFNDFGINGFNKLRKYLSYNPI